MPRKKEAMLEFFRLISIPVLDRIERGLPDTLVALSEHLSVKYDTIMRWNTLAKVRGISPVEGTPVIPQSKDEQEWNRFMKQLTEDAAERGATAPTRTLYAQLKGKMPKTSIDLKVGLSADEIARRNLEATKQLEEGGFR